MLLVKVFRELKVMLEAVSRLSCIVVHRVAVWSVNEIGFLRWLACS